MFRTEDGVKPKRLPVSRALLVPAADSDANVSISAATIAERVLDLDPYLGPLQDPWVIQILQIAEQA